MNAIRSGFAKSFQFKGRASRSEFWWFAPVAIVFSGTVTWVFATLRNHDYWSTNWIVLFFALTPFWASGYRRMQDAGELGQDIFYPAALFFGIPLGLVSAFYAVGIVSPIIAFLLAMFVGLPLIAAGAFLIFVSVGPVIGQLLVPSEPGPNRFGPNPHEVPQ